MSSIHSAAIWAARHSFTPEQIDCTTAVVLKILDGKCKMDPDAQQAVMAIYQHINLRQGEKFSGAVHHLIALACDELTAERSEKIYRLRLYAEETIPKPVMKRYKAVLAEAFL